MNLAAWPDDPYRTADYGDLPEDRPIDLYRPGDDPGDDQLAGWSDE